MAGVVFTGFSGALTGTTNPQTLVMDGDKSVTATFAQPAGGCGIGPELALLLPLLGALRRRQATGNSQPS
jgi:hypothetical protein